MQPGKKILNSIIFLTSIGLGVAVGNPAMAQTPKLKKIIEYFADDSTKTKVEYEYYVIDKSPHDIKHGKYTWYFDNGKVKSRTNYSQGVPEGEFTTYNRYGGKRAEGNFANGKLNGEIKNYYPGGGLENRGHYINGVKEGAWKYYSQNGGLIKIILFKKGIPDTE